MSIIADIKQASAEFTDHVAKHRCRPTSSAVAAGETACTKRVELWMAYMGTAALWGREPDDYARQRAHFERNARPAA